MLGLNSMFKIFEKSVSRVPVSTQILQNTGGAVRRNVIKNAPEHCGYLVNNKSNSEITKQYATISKDRITNSLYFEGSRENPNNFTLDNIKSEIDSLEFVKEQYPDDVYVQTIKKMLYSNLEKFDSVLSKDHPNFEEIQKSFKILYYSVSSNPEMSEVFGIFFHYQTKIYERHYFNNKTKFDSVPELNSVSLGNSIKLKTVSQGDVVCHPIDYQVNIDTIKFAHEIATLRAASNILGKKMYHTADKTDVEQMLISQGKIITSFSKQHFADVLVAQNEVDLVKKDIKHTNYKKSTSQTHKPQIVRTTHSNHHNYCDSHIQKIDRELADTSISLKRQIILTGTKFIFEQSKLKNDVSLLNQINETEYSFSLIIANDYFAQ